MFNMLHRPNGRPPSKPRDRLDFKFSNFQALQVPKGWDRLVVSIISLETGKTITKLGKAYVKSGSCQWAEIISEFIWMSRDVSSKEFEESLIKIVVSMGSLNSSILGEATINLANFTRSRVATAFSQPLEKCSHGTVLQVKIQCVAPRTKIRDEESKDSSSQETDQNHDFGSQSSGSENQDQTITNSSLSEGYDSNKRNDAGVFADSPIPENVSVVSPSNDSLTSDTDKDKETVYSGPSLTNLGSSKNLLDAAEDAIDELRAEAKMWERNARKLMIDLEMSRKEFSDLSKKKEDVVMELSASHAEYDHLKSENEQLKLEVQKLGTNKATKDDSSVNDFERLIQIQRVLETETKHQQDINADLNQQLRQTQESNINLVTVLQELDETIEKQKIEIENISSLKIKFTELEKSVARISEDNRSLQASEKALQAEVLSLQERLREKSSELENGTKLKLSSSHDDDESDMDLVREVEFLNEKIQELDKDCAELTEENLELLIKLKDLNKDKSFDSSPGYESEVNDLKFQIGRHETDMKEKNAVIKELERTIEEHEKLKAKFELDYAGVVKDLEKKRSKVDLIKANLLSKEEESKLALQHQKELEIEVSELQQKNIHLEENCELVLSEKNDIYENVVNLQNDILVLQNTISASNIMEKKLEEFEIERNRLEVNLSGLQGENMQLRETVSGLEAQVEQLKDEMEFLQKERDHSKFIATTLQDEIQNLEVQVLDLKQKAADAEKQWHEVQTESEYLKSENQRLQASSTSLEFSNSELKIENQELHEECSDLVAQLDKLKTSLSDSEKKVEILENHLEDFAFRETTLKSEVDALVQENNSHKEKLHLEESLHQTISKKTTEFESLQKEVDELNAWKRNHEILMAENERTLKTLENCKISEEKCKTDINDLELKLTISDYERQELTKEMDTLKLQLQTISNLEKEIVILKSDLKECRVDKCKLEIALSTVSRDYEELNAVKISLSENISKLEDAMSDFEECKLRKSALEEKVLQMENDLAMKDVLHSPKNADQKNDLMEIKRANVQFKQKIRRLEKEKEVLLKKAQSLEEDLKLMEEKFHLQKEAANNHKSEDGAVSVDLATKEDSIEKEASESSNDEQNMCERTKLSLETELKDLSERYLEMSLKYAEVEAQREDLVMKLKASSGGKRWFS